MESNEIAGMNGLVVLNWHDVVKHKPKDGGEERHNRRLRAAGWMEVPQLSIVAQEDLQQHLDDNWQNRTTRRPSVRRIERNETKRKRAGLWDHVNMLEMKQQPMLNPRVPGLDQTSFDSPGLLFA